MSQLIAPGEMPSSVRLSDVLPEDFATIDLTRSDTEYASAAVLRRKDVGELKASELSELRNDVVVALGAHRFDVADDLARGVAIDPIEIMREREDILAAAVNGATAKKAEHEPASRRSSQNFGVSLHDAVMETELFTGLDSYESSRKLLGVWLAQCGIAASAIEGLVLYRTRTEDSPAGHISGLGEAPRVSEAFLIRAA